MCSGTNIALIYAATPMAIVAAGTLLLHETLSRAQWAGVVLALLGLLFVIAKGDPVRLLAVQFVAGDGRVGAGRNARLVPRRGRGDDPAQHLAGVAQVAGQPKRPGACAGSSPSL